MQDGPQYRIGCRCAGTGLAPADTDSIISPGHDGLALRGHHAQVVRLKIERHRLAGVGPQMSTLKAAQGGQRRAFDGGELEMEYPWPFRPPSGMTVGIRLIKALSP